MARLRVFVLLVSLGSPAFAGDVFRESFDGQGRTGVLVHTWPDAHRCVLADDPPRLLLCSVSDVIGQ